MKENKSKIWVVVVIIILVFVIGLVVGKIVYDKEEAKHVVSGLVTKMEKDLVVIKDMETNEYYKIKTKLKDFEIGNIVSVYAKNIKDYENMVVTDVNVLVKDTKEIIKTEESKVDKKAVVIKKELVKDEKTLVNYINSVEKAIDKNIKSEEKNIKDAYKTLVGFVFNGEKINGKTFKELPNDIKLEVLKKVANIDAKVEKSFANYKTTLEEKYYNVKNDIVASYLDLSAKLCSNKDSLCEKAKNEFATIKSDLKISWDHVTRIAEEDLTKLKDWYQVWLNK